mgnify:CR=1 FL=1
MVGEAAAPEWLQTRGILAAFGETEAEAVAHYVRFVAEGGKVLLVSRDGERLQAACEEIGSAHCHAMAADICDGRKLGIPVPKAVTRISSGPNASLPG